MSDQLKASAAPAMRAAVRRFVWSAVLPLLWACGEVTNPGAESVDIPDRPRLAAIPSRGAALDLDVATWNVEWFGDANNGPADDVLQRSNVRDVIACSVAPAPFPPASRPWRRAPDS